MDHSSENMSNEMAVNLNVLNALMKNKVVSNPYSTRVIGIK